MPPAPLPPETMVHVARDGVEIGAWPLALIRSLYTAGELDPTDHYWTEGAADWKPLFDLLLSETASPAEPTLPGGQKIFYTLDGKEILGPIATDQFVLEHLDRLERQKPPEVIVVPDFKAEGTTQWRQFSELPEAWMSPGVRSRLRQFTADAPLGRPAESGGAVFGLALAGCLLLIATALVVYWFLSGEKFPN
jgi:hypothetical protein